jgi:hypothetical protein
MKIDGKKIRGVRAEANTVGTAYVQAYDNRTGAYMVLWYKDYASEAAAKAAAKKINKALRELEVKI